MEPIERRRLLHRLALAGSALLIVYGVGLALRYPLGPSLNTPRASWISQVEPTWLNLFVHVGVLLALTLLYLAALRSVHTSVSLHGAASAARPLGWRAILLVVAFWLAFSGVLFLAAPGGESHDIFDYIFRGRMMTEYGANPLADTPIMLRRAAYFRYLAWHSNVDTYGPLWEMASYATTTAVRTTLQVIGWQTSTQPSCPQSAESCRILIAYLSGYRILAVALTGLSGWLIYALLMRNRPQLALAGLLTWLWNPLLVISSALGAHNDSLMIFLLLVMFCLLQRRLWLLALLALTLAAHVKLTALMLAPLAGLWIVRQIGWGRGLLTGLLAGGIGLGLSWLLYAPFAGWGTLPQMLYERSIFLANSAWRVLFRLTYIHGGWEFATAWRLTVQLPTYLFAAFALLLSFWMLDFRPKRWRKGLDTGDDRLLWRAALAVSLLYLLVGSFWFQHWYVVWVLAPAALLPDGRFARVILPWLCFGALAANVSANFIGALPGLSFGATTTATITVVCIWVPFAIASVWVARSSRSAPLSAFIPTPTADSSHK